MRLVRVSYGASGSRVVRLPSHGREGGPGGRRDAGEDLTNRRRRTRTAKSIMHGAEKVFGHRRWRRRRERGMRRNFRKEVGISCVRTHIIFILRPYCSELYFAYDSLKGYQQKGCSYLSMLKNWQLYSVAAQSILWCFKARPWIAQDDNGTVALQQDHGI